MRVREAFNMGGPTEAFNMATQQRCLTWGAVREAFNMGGPTKAFNMSGPMKSANTIVRDGLT